MELTKVVVELNEQAQVDCSGEEAAELNALQLTLVGGGFGVVTPI